MLKKPRTQLNPTKSHMISLFANTKGATTMKNTNTNTNNSRTRMTVKQLAAQVADVKSDVAEIKATVSNVVAAVDKLVKSLAPVNPAAPINKPTAKAVAPKAKFTAKAVKPTDIISMAKAMDKMDISPEAIAREQARIAALRQSEVRTADAKVIKADEIEFLNLVALMDVTYLEFRQAVERKDVAGMKRAKAAYIEQSKKFRTLRSKALKGGYFSALREAVVNNGLAGMRVRKLGYLKLITEVLEKHAA